MTNRFTITNLAEVSGEFPPLDSMGVAYLGHPCNVSGPTGSAKTMIGRAILLEEKRAGRVVGHADMEMSAPLSRRYYLAHGVPESELPDIRFWDYPEPRIEEVADWREAILDAGVEALLMDKLSDFLRSAGIEENSNDGQNEWASAFLEKLNGQVTTYVLDSTGWDSSRTRGGSEKLFKYATAWVVDVTDQPSKTHVGRVRWRCVKDRFGAIGVGTTVEFEVGGDGEGGIVFAKAATKAANDATDEVDPLPGMVRRVVKIAKEHAPNEVRAVTTSQLKELLGPGRGQDKVAAIEAASNEIRPWVDRLAKKPGARTSVMYWFEPGDPESVPHSGNVPGMGNEDRREQNVPRSRRSGSKERGTRNVFVGGKKGTKRESGPQSPSGEVAA